MSGPFQTSPLSIIPKPGQPGKFRLVQNFSFPIIPNDRFPFPAINSYINPCNFPATWGKFSIVFLLTSCLPPGSEVATQDVAEAYRTVPLHPSQWPAAIVRTSPTHGCIDTCAAFGATPSAGIYGHVADAAAEIMRFHGISPLDKWVDDHIFFRVQLTHLTEYNNDRIAWHSEINQHSLQHQGGRIWFQGTQLQDGSHEEFNEDCSQPIANHAHASPRSDHDALFTYALSDINALSDELGIPWETSKDQPFAHSTIYIGFIWNLQDKTVSLTPTKLEKYLRAIDEWNARATHTLEDVQKIYGKLLHTASLIPAGRAYLTGFERMMAVCGKKPFLPHHPDKAIKDDLLWWRHIISTGKASCLI